MRRLLVVLYCFLVSSAVQAADCGIVPFSVQAKEAGLDIFATLPAKYSDPSNLPKPATVALGGEYVRSMYGAMGPTVVRTLLTDYSCRFNNSVDEDKGLTLEEAMHIKAAFQDAVDDLVSTSAMYFPTFAMQNMEQARLLQPSLANAPALTKEARVPLVYLQKSIGTIPDNSFLFTSSYSYYVQGKLKGIEATACGKLIRAALAENASLVQQLAASMRSTLFTYFSESPSGVRSAKTKLFGEAASAASITAPVKLENKPIIAACAA